MWAFFFTLCCSNAAMIIGCNHAAISCHVPNAACATAFDYCQHTQGHRLASLDNEGLELKSKFTLSVVPEFDIDNSVHCTNITT